MALKPLPRSGTVSRQKLCDGVVQIRYARTKKHPYGTLGAPRRVYWEPKFAQVVEAAVDSLLYHSKQSPLVNELTDLTCAGAWHDTVAKNKQNPDHGVCRHCQGRAIDIDALRFKSRALVTKNFPWNRKLYLGVESVLRLYFGTVLAYWFNLAHQDHFHCDNGTKPVMRRSDFSVRFKSRVLYLQLACKYVHGFDPGPLDGKWGGHTAKAVGSVLCQLGWKGLGVGVRPGPIETAVEVALRDGGYRAYCEASALVGFGIVESIAGI